MKALPALPPIRPHPARLRAAVWCCSVLLAASWQAPRSAHAQERQGAAASVAAPQAEAAWRKPNVLPLGEPEGAVLVLTRSKVEADALCKTDTNNYDRTASGRNYWLDTTAQRFAVVCVPGDPKRWALVGAGSPSVDRGDNSWRDQEFIDMSLQGANGMGYVPPQGRSTQRLNNAHHLRLRQAVRKDATSYVLERPALPPLTQNVNVGHLRLAPEGFAWPGGGEITNLQLAFLALTELLAEAPVLQPAVQSSFAALTPLMLRDLAALPRVVAEHNPHLARLVDAAVAAGRVADTRLAQMPPATYERVAAFVASTNGVPPTYESARDGFGLVAALDPQSPCAKGIYGAVAKLMRNHETIVLRPSGRDLNYFKDRYRPYFFEKNIAAMNDARLMQLDFASFRVVGGEGVSRTAGIEIVPNAACTSAFVKLVYFGGTTTGSKYYAISIARIDANFARDADTGRVGAQSFRVQGFGNEWGTAEDFAYSCDEDTCKRVPQSAQRKP